MAAFLFGMRPRLGSYQKHTSCQALLQLWSKLSWQVKAARDAERMAPCLPFSRIVQWYFCTAGVRGSTGGQS